VTCGGSQGPINCYDSLAPVFDESMGDDFAAVAHPLVIAAAQSRANRPFEGERHLDICCGTGTLLCHTASNLRMRGYGIDISEGQLKVAKYKASARNLEISFVCSDATATALPKELSLVTITMDALNHVTTFQGWRSLLTRVLQALRPGGLFVCDLNTSKRLLCDWTVPEVIVKETLTYVQVPLFSRRETDGVARSGILIDVFKEDSGRITRHRAVVEQVAMETAQVLEILRGIGFGSVGRIAVPRASATAHVFMKNRAFLWAQKAI